MHNFFRKKPSYVSNPRNALNSYGPFLVTGALSVRFSLRSFSPSRTIRATRRDVRLMR
jgi:hypothetical protein